MVIKILFLLFASTSCFAGPSTKFRPCQLTNTRCVREIFRSNSKCNPNVSGSIPVQYTIPQVAFDAPYFNSTYVDRNLKIRNHNRCYISEFFYNSNSETIVFAIDCPLLGFESSRTLIQHSSLAEDTVFEYSYNGIYPLIRLTANFAHAKAMDACNSYIFADVTALPIFQINPNNLNTANFLSKDLSLLNIFERETFHSRGKQLMLKYINSYICNFGCK